jgi:hypothetical protein
MGSSPALLIRTDTAVGSGHWAHFSARALGVCNDGVIGLPGSLGLGRDDPPDLE